MQPPPSLVDSRVVSQRRSSAAPSGPLWIVVGRMAEDRHDDLSQVSASVVDAEEPVVEDDADAGESPWKLLGRRGLWLDSRSGTVGPIDSIETTRE